MARRRVKERVMTKRRDDNHDNAAPDLDESPGDRAEGLDPPPVGRVPGVGRTAVTASCKAGQPDAIDPSERERRDNLDRRAPCKPSQCEARRVVARVRVARGVVVRRTQREPPAAPRACRVAHGRRRAHRLGGGALERLRGRPAAPRTQRLATRRRRAERASERAREERRRGARTNEARRERRTSPHTLNTGDRAACLPYGIEATPRGYRSHWGSADGGGSRIARG